MPKSVFHENSVEKNYIIFLRLKMLKNTQVKSVFMYLFGNFFV
jgi:hypothetical protein